MTAPQGSCLSGSTQKLISIAQLNTNMPDESPAATCCVSCRKETPLRRCSAAMWQCITLAHARKHTGGHTSAAFPAGGDTLKTLLPLPCGNVLLSRMPGWRGDRQGAGPLPLHEGNARYNPLQHLHSSGTSELSQRNHPDGRLFSPSWSCSLDSCHTNST